MPLCAPACRMGSSRSAMAQASKAPRQIALVAQDARQQIVRVGQARDTGSGRARATL